MLYIIRLDGQTVGVAEAAENIGPLAWFHENKPSCSMAHALEHEGYSVEATDALDCHDVAPILEAIAARTGLMMESVFVPFSKSRNAKPGDDGKVWQSLNWEVTLKRHGRHVLTTDYSQGTGHVPNPGKLKDRQFWRIDQIRDAIETGRFRRENRMLATERVPAPALGDVLHSLVRDADVLDAGGFEEWAADLGYETDSRKAEATYRACLEIGLKLRAALGPSLLAEMRTVAGFN